MTLHDFFLRQLAQYATYHRHPKNRRTHFIGIPAIVFAILCPLMLWRLRLAGFEINGAWLVAILAVAGWMALDVGVGLAMVGMILPMLLVGGWIVGKGGPVAAWAMFLLFFTGGWMFQIIGHLWEGRRPALVDNLFQLFIGPMFIVVEVLVMLGRRDDLRQTVEAAGVVRGA